MDKGSFRLIVTDLPVNSLDGSPPRVEFLLRLYRGVHESCAFQIPNVGVEIIQDFTYELLLFSSVNI